MDQTHTYDVVIIGGGAAGLMAAATLSQRQKKTLLIEHNTSLGKKILISGGGRCNFTNLHASAQDYLCQNPHFVKSALAQFTAQDFINWVKEADIPFYEKKLGQLFCKTTARDILDLLLSKINSQYVDMALSTHVKKIDRQDRFYIDTDKKDTLQSASLIIACGGLSFDKLGASDFGYHVAQQFGHTLIPTQPALDGFALQKNDLSLFQSLPGVALPVSISIDQHIIEDDLLFTHNGLSGPAALKASLYWQNEMPLNINFAPWTSQKNCLEMLKLEKQKHGHKNLKSILKADFPTRFLEHFLPVAQQQQKIAELSTQNLQTLSQRLCAFAITPKSTIGYHKAEVTKGGVNTDNISSKSMESKLCPGLYFIGEVLDVTGQLGGYNFQWAWSSGFAAGQHAGKN